MSTVENFELTPDESIQPDFGSQSAADRMKLVNYVYEGKNRVGIDTNKIIGDLLQATENWPRVVAGKLFVPSGNKAHRPLVKPEELFAWLGLRFQVDWWQGPGAMTKAEFFAALKMRCTSFQRHEVYPHYPPVSGILYSSFHFQHSNGLKLQEFVDFFGPSTAEDRQLIIGLILTAFWGGGGGQRPAFLVTSNDTGTRLGRGSGKSILATLVAELCGGYFDMGQSETIEKLKTRFLTSADAEDVKRIVRIDNIKSRRFSWAELEALITSPEISGHQMYQGNAQKRNLYTFVMTINGASLSKDLAERTVVIKLKPAKYRSGWNEELNAFIAQHRTEIIGDTIELLKTPAAILPERGTTRWEAWESAVLSKLDNAEKLRKMIVERQAEIDDDKNESEQFFSALREHLTLLTRSRVGPTSGLRILKHEVLRAFAGDFYQERIASNVLRKKIQSLGLISLQPFGKKGRERSWLLRLDGKKITKAQLRDAEAMSLDTVSVMAANDDDPFSEDEVGQPESPEEPYQALTSNDETVAGNA